MIFSGGIGTLTDFAVYFGLRHMQNMRTLEINEKYTREIQDVSAEAFNFLVKSLPKLEKCRVLNQKWEREEILK